MAYPRDVPIRSTDDLGGVGCSLMGQRVVIGVLGETPLEAIEQHAALEPMAVPVPAAHEVVIAIASAAVGWVDLIMASGQYQHVPKPPYTPGLEYAGTIAHAGAESGFTEGERVMLDPFLAGPRSHGDYQRAGGFATHALVPAAAVRRIPGTLTFDQACNLLGNYETAYHCLIARGHLAAGETVLIHGASGSTGLAAVHLAKLVGARVIATGRSPAKLEAVKAEGADHVMSSTGFRDEVKALTEGRGVDVVYDAVGGEISLESLRCVRFGARFLIVGWASTPFVARGKVAANHLPTNLIMMKGLDVLGCPAVISAVNDPAMRDARVAQLLMWVEAGRIQPHVSRVFPLVEFKDALRAKWKGEIVGGCVLRP
ncbi:MAG: NADPH:quinone oxidoreductase family protein [Deltaproteobacteria bacterium]|nr:NADPH:quinone oxidoreductase family protein [Deltaproteobacteria bacterium]